VAVLGELFSEIVQLMIGVPFLRDLVVAIETFLPRLFRVLLCCIRRCCRKQQRHSESGPHQKPTLIIFILFLLVEFIGLKVTMVEMTIFGMQASLPRPG